MRIERLLLENIASFKGKTEIHFDEISNQSDLFAITGPTGSGKSTILTSISMALFGVHPRGLNSSDIVSMGKPNGRIECDFLSGGKKYTAEWTCAVLKKNGEPRKTPLITRLLLDEDGTVEETIEDLIGLNFDQFSKVVILNQGQFSTFLTSSFTDRKDLLEKLLEHHDLKILARFLKNKMSHLEKDYEAGKTLTENMKLLEEQEVKEKEKQIQELNKKNQERESFINSLSSIQERLKNNIEGEAKKNEINLKIKGVTKEADSLSIEVNKKRHPLDIKKKELLSLKSKLKKETPLIEEGVELSQRKEKLSHEKEIKTDQLNKEKNRQGELSDRISESKAKIEKLEEDFEVSNKVTKGLTAEFFEQVLIIKRKISEADKNLALIKDSKISLSEKTQGIQKEGENAKKELDQVLTWFKGQDVNTENLKETISNLNKEQKEKNTLIQKIEFQKEKIDNQTAKKNDVFTKIEAINKKELELKEKLKSAKSEGESIKKSILSTQEKIKKETLIREILKDHLKSHSDSTDCPVCSSTISLEKQNELKEILSSQHLDTEEKGLEKQQDKLETLEKSIFLYENNLKEIHLEKENYKKEEFDLAKDLETLNLDLKSFKTNLQKLSHLDDLDFEVIEEYLDQFNSLQFKINDSRIRWSETNEELKLFQKKENAILEGKKELDQKLKDLLLENEYLSEQDENTLTNLYKKAQGQVYLKKEIEHLNKTLQSNNKSKEENDAAILLLNDQVEKLGTSILDIEKVYKDKGIPREPVAYRKSAEHKITQTEEVIAEDEKVLLDLELSLEKKKTIIKTLNEQLEDQIKLLVFYRSELEKEISKFHSELTSSENSEKSEKQKETHNNLFTYFEKITFTLLKKEETDSLDQEILAEFSTDFLDSTLSQEQMVLKEDKEKKIILQTQINENEKQKNKIQEKAKEIQKLEAELAKLRFLSPFILKDSFRDFALEVLEETLLDLANQEIDSLADGRYQLVHGKAGKKSELIVIDHWQSQSKRKVSTLSGGETFLLSLGLALGLSELTRGQTEVECFFIDEGFGTLDEESISQVLDCLMHIQSRGKQIGLISHVKLLTNQIPVRIELEKNNFGEATLNLN